MKKVLFTFAVCLSSAAFAQVLDVASLQKVAMPENKRVVVAGISPQGDYLLVTDNHNQGLSKYDLATGNNGNYIGGRCRIRSCNLRRRTDGSLS